MHLDIVGTRVPVSPQGIDVQITFADFDPTTVTGVFLEAWPVDGGAPIALTPCTFNATTTVLTIHHLWQAGDVPARSARYELVAVITCPAGTFPVPCRESIVRDLRGG